MRDPLDDATEAMRTVVRLEMELEQQIRALRESYAAKIDSARQLARAALITTGRKLSQMPASQVVPQTNGGNEHVPEIPGGETNTKILRCLSNHQDAEVQNIALAVLGSDDRENRRLVSARLSTLKKAGLVELVERGRWRATLTPEVAQLLQQRAASIGAAHKMPEDDDMDPP